MPRCRNPELEEETRESTAVVVAPEWRVLQAAHGAKQRSGEESARHMRTFRKFFKEVDARSRTRLRVDKSAVQVGGGLKSIYLGQFWTKLLTITTYPTLLPSDVTLAAASADQR